MTAFILLAISTFIPVSETGPLLRGERIKAGYKEDSERHPAVSVRHADGTLSTRLKNGKDERFEFYLEDSVEDCGEGVSIHRRTIHHNE